MATQDGATYKSVSAWNYHNKPGYREVAIASNKKWVEKNADKIKAYREEYNARRKAQYHNDPEYAERERLRKREEYKRKKLLKLEAEKLAEDLSGL